MSRKTTPSGSPIEPFSTVPKKALKAVSFALEIINAVHGDGLLEQIPLRTKNISAKGYYQFEQESGAPIEFTFKTGLLSLVTIIHEIAHALDHQAIGTPRVFASLSTEFQGSISLVAVMQAITQSMAYQKIRAYRIGQVIDRRVVTENALTYHLDKREWFARAYVQYIAIRSGQPELLAFIAVSNLENNPHLVYPEAWSVQDYAPILSALEQLFLQKQWLK